MIKYLLRWLRPVQIWTESWPIRLPLDYISGSGAKVIATKAKVVGGKVMYEITWQKC